MQIWWSDVSLVGSFWIFDLPHWTPRLILRRCFVSSIASQSRNTQPCTKSLPTHAGLSQKCGRFIPHLTIKYGLIWPLGHWIDVVPNLTHHQIWSFELEKKTDDQPRETMFFFRLTFWRQPHVSSTWPTQLQCSAVSLPVFGPGRGQSLPKNGFIQRGIHPTTSMGISPANIRRDYQIIIDYHDFIWFHSCGFGRRDFCDLWEHQLMGDGKWACMTHCMSTSCFRGRVVLNQNGVWLPCAVMGLE